MIKRLLDRCYITPSQARGIEMFALWLFFSFAFGLLDNLELLLNGEAVDWNRFLIIFAGTTMTAVLAGVRKYLRDLQANQDNA